MTTAGPDISKTQHAVWCHKNFIFQEQCVKYQFKPSFPPSFLKSKTFCLINYILCCMCDLNLNTIEHLKKHHDVIFM